MITMTEIHIYVANDGERFDCVEDCEAHEFDLEVAKMAKNAEFWNLEGSPMTPTLYEMDAVNYMRFDTDESAQMWNGLYNEAGYNCARISEAGFYWFDDNGELVSFTDEMNDLLALKKKFKIGD